MRARVRDCQALTGIERELRRTEPRLVGLLDLFTRLHAAEAMPACERISRSAAQRRLVVVVTILAAGLVCLSLIVAAHAGAQQASTTLTRVQQSTRSQP